MQSLEYNGHMFWIQCRASNPSELIDLGPGASYWEVDLGYGPHDYITVPFAMGEAHQGEPELLDVLECVLGDTQAGALSFSEFLDEYGFEHPKKAYATWEACQEISDDFMAMMDYCHVDVGELHQWVIERECSAD